MASNGVSDVEGSKAYLSKHNLHSLFEQLAADVLAARPEDPVPFLYAKLGERLPAEKRAPAKQAEAPAEAKQAAAPAPSHRIIFVLGGPGSGKGTQCQKLVAEKGFLHVSAGDLLREEAAKETEQGKSIATIIKEGKIVPGHVTIGLLKAWIASKPAGSTILVDGFPRELRQALDFERDIMPCAFVLFFTATDATLENRLLQRGLTSNRADDNIATIKKRLATFHRETSVVSEYFRALDRLREVNAEAAVDAVYAETAKLF